MAAASGVAVVIPTFNEAESIGAVVAALPRDIVDRVIVADGGSTDGTVGIARARGRRGDRRGRGYGRACLAGAQAADNAEIVVFMDGDGADDPAAIATWSPPFAPAATISSSARACAAKREPRQHGGHQILAGLAAGALIGSSTACATPTCAPSRHPPRHAAGARHARTDLRLEPRNADARGARRLARARTAGRLSPPHRRRSKVAGNLRGSIKAGTRIVATFARVAMEPSPARPA
jgi:glycosyltransferase involved in cell wall biosynthesis